VLALADALRVGRARERSLARTELAKRLAGSTVADMLAWVATFPPGTRTKEDIDRQVAEEHASWDRD
jgi:hypothetical protein